MATQDWWAIAKEHMNEQRAGNFTLLMRSMEPFIREKCVECRGAYTDADFAYREYSAGTGNPVTL